MREFRIASVISSFTAATSASGSAGTSRPSSLEMTFEMYSLLMWLTGPVGCEGRPLSSWSILSPMSVSTTFTPSLAHLCARRISLEMFDLDLTTSFSPAISSIKRSNAASMVSAMSTLKLFFLRFSTASRSRASLPTERERTSRRAFFMPARAGKRPAFSACLLRTEPNAFDIDSFSSSVKDPGLVPKNNLFMSLTVFIKPLLRF